MKKAIAMRCTKEQFEAIKPKLEEKGLINNVCGSFEDYNYLTNPFEELHFYNFSNHTKETLNMKREVYETWNEKVFLEACGISTPEQKTYSLTKEQLRSITDPQVKNWFPEVFELPKDLTGWTRVTCGGNEKYLTYFDKGILKYGFDGDGIWFDNHKYNSEIQDFHFEATESEVFKALKNEAVKRGFVEGAWFKGCAGNQKNEILQLDYFKFAAPGSGGFSPKNIGLYAAGYNSWIFHGGKWAEIIPTKTKAEAEKELNCKIID